MPLVLQISFFTSPLLTGKNQYKGGVHLFWYYVFTVACFCRATEVIGKTPDPNCCATQAMTEAFKKKFCIGVIGWKLGLHIRTPQGMKLFCSWHRSNCPGKPFLSHAWTQLVLGWTNIYKICTTSQLHKSSPPPLPAPGSGNKNFPLVS